MSRRSDPDSSEAVASPGAADCSICPAPWRGGPSHDAAGRRPATETAWLVALWDGRQLGEDQAVGVLAGGEQVDLVALGPGRRVQAFAVDRHCVRPAAGAGAPVGRPAAPRLVQRVPIDAAQQPPYRRLRRQSPLRAQRVGPYAKAFTGRVRPRSVRRRAVPCARAGVCTAPGAPAATTRAPSRQAGWAVMVQRRLVARVRATYKSLSPPGRAVMISSGLMTTTPSNSRPRASDAGTMRAW